MSIMLLYAIIMGVIPAGKVNKFLSSGIKSAFLHLLYKARNHATKLPDKGQWLCLAEATFLYRSRLSCS